MAYTAWSVVYGEQPTAAKWNQLGANDAGFRDGTNFALNNNVIPANALATNSILLGSATRSTDFTTTSTSPVLVTGLTSTVTVPAGGRSVKLTFFARNMYNLTAGRYMAASIWDGTVGSGTKLGEAAGYDASGGTGQPVCITSIHTPAAGSKTYNVGLQTFTSGTAGLSTSGSTVIMLLLVEVV